MSRPPDRPIEVLSVDDDERFRRVLAAAPSREEAAKILGIDPSTLYRKRKQYGL